MVRVLADVERDDDIHESSVYPSYVDSDRRVDVERFIFGLTQDETLVVLFSAMSFKPKEICNIVGRKNVNFVYNILAKLRRGKVWEQEF